MLPVGLIKTDSDLSILEFNEAAREWLGRSSQPVIGEKFERLLTSGSRFFFLSHIYPLLNLSGVAEEVYLSLTQENNGELPVVLNAVRNEDRSHQFAFLPIRRRALFESHLIDSRKMAEAAALAEQEALRRLGEAQTQMAIQERLATMGMLAASVAHELNNPLSYVLGNLELLSGCQLPPEETEYVKDANEGVLRIKEIVSSLKVLSRAEDKRKAMVDLNEVGKVAKKLMGREALLRCQIHCEWSAEPVFLLGDEGRLTQVVLNLLLNASQAFSSRNSANNRITLKVYRCEHRAALEVSDNGPGVPEHIQDQVFEPFFTTKPVGVGTGLGLSICRSIVESLDGDICLASSSEGGARFLVTFPLAGSAPETAASVRSTASPAVGKLSGLRCLLIEDDPLVLGLLKKSLGADWCTTCCNGPKALEQLSQGDFDVILCDVMMPELTGPELYQAVAQTRPELAKRFIFLTGGALNAEVRTFLEDSLQPVLYKPFSPAEVIRVCNQVSQSRPSHG